MQFYIFVTFLGLIDDIHEEKPSFLEFKKKRITDQPTDGPTDGRTDRLSYRDARTHLKMVPCHRVLPSFYKPLLLSTWWSESLEIFILLRKLAILSILCLMIIRTLFLEKRNEDRCLSNTIKSCWGKLTQIDANVLDHSSL